MMQIERKSFIPNYEVATAFELALQTGSWKEIAESISKCDELLDETIDGNAEKEWLNLLNLRMKHIHPY